MAVSRRGGVDGPDAQDAGLNEEVPHPARLIDVNLDELARLAPPQLSTAPRVLTYQGLFDDEVGLRQDAELGTERLLFGCEQV